MATDHPMQLGMVGLGRMGANLVRRLMGDGHRCVVYDVNAAAVSELAGEGAVGADSLADLVTKLDVPEIAELWRRGSVVMSWLVDLTADALARSPRLDDFEGLVSDSGEGRWTVVAAVEQGVPAPVINAALSERFESRSLGEYGDKILSAMSSEFGGHAEKTS